MPAPAGAGPPCPRGPVPPSRGVPCRRPARRLPERAAGLARGRRLAPKLGVTPADTPLEAGLDLLAPPSLRRHRLGHVVHDGLDQAYRLRGRQVQYNLGVTGNLEPYGHVHHRR